FGGTTLEALNGAERAPFLASRTTGVAWRDGRRIGKIDLAMIDRRPVELRTAFVVRRMQADAARAGVQLHVVSGFRSNGKQTELRRLFLSGRGHDAAPPGYSNHQDGTAIDWNADTARSAQYRWLKAHGADYGFKRTVPGELWHWEYQPDV